MSGQGNISDMELYRRYIEPLEAEHRGKYAAIHPCGRFLIGNDPKDLSKRAAAQLGEGIAVFQIGRLISPGFRWLCGVPELSGTPVHPDEESAFPETFSEMAERRANLYRRYGEPLEAKHWGKHVAIQPDGKVIIDGDYDVLVDRARAEFGQGSMIFKVGGKNNGVAVKPMELILRHHD